MSRATTRYRERRACGLCGECGQPAIEGRTKCQRHLDKTRNEVARIHGRRIAAATCRQCGAPLAAASTRLCEKHLHANRAYVQRCVKRSAPAT